MMRLRFLDEPPPPPAEFAVAGLIPRRGLTLLVGAQEAGKSVLAAELAVAIVRGGAWAGRDIAPAGSVLYVAPERAEVQERRIRAHIGFDRCVAVAPDAFNLRDGNAIDFLRDAIRRVEAHSGKPIALVVIDTFAAAAPGIRENETTEVEPIASALRRLSGEIGAPIVLIHHTGKDGLIRGSTALPAAADAILIVKSDKHAARRLIPDKLSDGGPKAGPIEFQIENIEDAPRVLWRGSHDPTACGDDASEPRITPTERIILDAIQSVRISHPNASRDDIRNAVYPVLGRRSDGAKRTALSNGLKALVSKGFLGASDPLVSVRNNANPNGPNDAAGTAVSVSVRTPPSIRGGVHALTRPDEGEIRPRGRAARRPARLRKQSEPSRTEAAR